MEIYFESIDEGTRRIYERYFFQRICSMSVGNRIDFTIPLPQIEGLFFTSVQDTVERLTELSGRVSTFQWRNCIFAPISTDTKPREIYEKIFKQLKTKVPSLFVRSYVYLIFIKFKSVQSSAFDFGEGPESTIGKPSSDDFQIYYWNTKYEVKPGGKKNLFGDSGVDSSHEGDTDSIKLEAKPEKLFIVQNPAHELQRIQDANSDIIDAFRAFNNQLPLVEQTQSYLEAISREIDRNQNTRILVEGPARSGKTVLAMSLLARYPKSKMLLMNWYFYDALIDAFKIWAELSADEIEQLFAMPKVTTERVSFQRKLLTEFKAWQSNTRGLNVALKAIEVSINPRCKMPRWCAYTNGKPTAQGEKFDEWRVKPVNKSDVGDVIPVVTNRGNSRVMKIVEILNKHYDGSASVRDIPELPEFTAEYKENLLEYKKEIEAGQGDQYISKILKDIADALHNSTQRFFHHNLEQSKGCWIQRGNPTTCNITSQDLIICDEVQRLGVIPEIRNRDRFDEAKAIFENSKQSFLCGDDFQMLNPIYDQGIGPIERAAGGKISKLKLPDSIGVPAEVGQLIKYLLGEHDIPKRNSGFEIQLLYKDDIGLVRLFEEDRSTKKHYAIPNNSGFYRNDPFIQKVNTKSSKCTVNCGPSCEHTRISMLTEDLRQKFKFFCSEAVMPNYALSAYELISREVESVYLKIPEEIGLEIVRKPIGKKLDNQVGGRNWKKQHLYVLMTRATMKLVVNVESRALYEDLFERLQRVRSLD